MADIDISGGGIPSLTNTLTDTHIFVGDINNEPQDVALTLSATGGTFALANTGVLTMPNADATTRGLLTAADWVTFNNKQNAIPDWTTGFGSGTQATSTWTATNAATNVNAAIVPKGTGAIVAQLPDGTITGGNSRGQYSVDLQRIRNNANQVASGNYSSVLGGSQNRASGLYATTLGGFFNVSTGDYSISGGFNSDASGYNSIALGDSTASGSQAIAMGTSTATGELVIAMGRSCSAGGTRGNVAMGNSCTASGDGSVALGAFNTAVKGAYCIGESLSASAQYSAARGFKTISNLWGQGSFGAANFSANGDCQGHELIWNRQITGTAQTELFLDGSSLTAILPTTNTVWHGIIDISSICTVAGAGTTIVGDVAATSYKATIKRLNTNTTLVGTVQEIGTINADTSMAAVAFTIDANNTNESLRIQFTPPPTAAADTVIRVIATFRGTQIKY